MQVKLAAGAYSGWIQRARAWQRGVVWCEVGHTACGTRASLKDLQYLLAARANERALDGLRTRGQRRYREVLEGGTSVAERLVVEQQRTPSQTLPKGTSEGQHHDSCRTESSRIDTDTSFSC